MPKKRPLIKGGDFESTQALMGKSAGFDSYEQRYMTDIEYYLLGLRVFLCRKRK